MDKISASALETRAVLATMPANPDALSFLPRGNTGADFIDDAGDFVSGNARILNSGPGALFREHVTVADTTGLHRDANLSCARFRNLALDNFKVSSGFGNL